MGEKKKGKFQIKPWMVIVLLVVVIAAAVGIPKLVTAIQTGAFKAGNDEQYSVANTETNEESPLAGQTVIFLGSSVTYGYASGGESFADYLEKVDGITAVKEAVSGTTLVDEQSGGEDSYVTRMKTIDTEIEADAFVCQLSTNDASQGKELGEISDSYDMEDFDVLTVTGAIEYIIAYARATWDCPVIFFTVPQYESEAYQAMVDRLLELQEKWEFDIIDMWNDEEFNDITDEEYNLYMSDQFHPTKAGYRDWWLSKFEEDLTACLGLG